IYEGRLCVGTWPSGKVFRLGDQDHWEDLGRLGQELEVMSMLVHNGKLYAGTLPLAEIYRYDGGQKWTRIKQLDTTPDVKFRRVWSMAQHSGKLACGVLPSGHVHGLETGKSATSGWSVKSGWSHIVAVKQGPRVTAYCDAQSCTDGGGYHREETAVDVPLSVNNGQPLRIGGGAGDTFWGRISDVRIYRGALSHAERSSLATAPLMMSSVKQIIAHRGASTHYPENTLLACTKAREARATCVEIDVRQTKDGVLVPFHDATLDRTTNGTGPVNQMTWAELKALDAGSWKDPSFHMERPTAVKELISYFHIGPPSVGSEVIPDALKLSPAERMDLLLDLKEDGADFIDKVISTVKASGDPEHIIWGVRTVQQAKRIREALPKSRQLGLIANPQEIEAFAAAGVETIRLWPKWLQDETLVPRVRKAGAKLHLNGETGLPDEIRPLLRYQPDSLSTSDPRQLVETLLGLD
ncbi:MAG: hypothetical protein JWM11_7282, partial [Planctomycetaceae bacterium]|nr:hypothetical protein [Planctomycetaceae bacterium]